MVTKKMLMLFLLVSTAAYAGQKNRDFSCSKFVFLALSAAGNAFEGVGFNASNPCPAPSEIPTMSGQFTDDRTLSPVPVSVAASGTQPLQLQGNTPLTKRSFKKKNKK